MTRLCTTSRLRQTSSADTNDSKYARACLVVRNRGGLIALCVAYTRVLHRDPGATGKAGPRAAAGAVLDGLGVELESGGWVRLCIASRCA